MLHLTMIITLLNVVDNKQSYASTDMSQFHQSEIKTLKITGVRKSLGQLKKTAYWPSGLSGRPATF